jgi:hypothetical protein
VLARRDTVGVWELLLLLLLLVSKHRLFRRPFGFNGVFCPAYGLGWPTPVHSAPT